MSDSKSSLTPSERRRKGREVGGSTLNSTCIRRKVLQGCWGVLKPKLAISGSLSGLSLSSHPCSTWSFTGSGPWEAQPQCKCSNGFLNPAARALGHLWSLWSVVLEACCHYHHTLSLTPHKEVQETVPPSSLWPFFLRGES